eukprot:1147309-Pelagomonas_calceolata.AAC.2
MEPEAAEFPVQSNLELRPLEPQRVRARGQHTGATRLPTHSCTIGKRGNKSSMQNLRMTPGTLALLFS